MSIPPFEIESLLTKYELEPEIKDLFVEGPTDKRILTWFFKKAGLTDVDVFEITDVDVPPEVVSSYMLNTGNRSKVIALALELSTALEKKKNKVYCLADSDFDFVLSKDRTAKRLIYTDYTSIDLYFCSEDTVEKILMLNVGEKPSNFDKMFSKLIQILEDVFLIRATNEYLGWGCKFHRFETKCRIEKNNISFDVNKYIKNYLITNGRYSKKDEFNKAYKKFKRMKLESYKFKTRGRDFFVLFGRYLAKACGSVGKKFKSEEIVSELFLSDFDAADLPNEKLFKKLIKLYTS